MDSENNAFRASPFKWTHARAKALAKQIIALKESGAITYKNVLLETGIAKPPAKGERDPLPAAQQRFSRWLNNVEDKDAWRLMDEHEFRALTIYVMRLQGGARGGRKSAKDAFPDAMFHGMIDWLGSSTESLHDLQENFPGVYAIYRPSLLHRGHVAVGRLTIALHRATGVVHTKEEYRIERTDKMDETFFEIRGYLFRNNGKYHVLAKNVHSHEPQTLYINDVVPRGGKVDGKRIGTMSGTLFDVQGRKFYATRFACVRKDAERLHTIPFEHVPPEIRTELEAPIQVGGQIVKF